MEKLRSYELTLVLAPQEKSELEKARKNIDLSLEKRKAQVTKKEDWGERRLFHEKKHHQKGFFHFFEFKADPADMASIMNDLSVNANVLKSMIAKA